MSQDQVSETGRIAPKQAPLTIHAQYIKDLSFENPNAPATLLPGQPVPEMSVNVNMDARSIDPVSKNGKSYEVAMMIEATAKRGETVVFMAQLEYAVVCSMAEDVPEKHHHPLLMVEAPKLAFPFVRQILADLTGQAGYLPLLLNPVDFEGMYKAHFLAQQKAEGTA